MMKDSNENSVFDITYNTSSQYLMVTKKYKRIYLIRLSRPEPARRDTQ